MLNKKVIDKPIYMENIVSKCIEQFLDLMDHVENVGIEERWRSGRQEKTLVAKTSHEIVNNFLIFNF